MLDINNNKIASKTPRVLAITGGKGGVGKTSVAVNLAISLSRNGSRTCLFDADTALGNLNIMLGIQPSYTLEHLLSGEKNIEDVVVEGPERIHLVPGASGAAQCAELDVVQQRRLVRGLQVLENDYDYMIVDTAAGISPTVLHFVAASQVAAIVVTPEPTSLTDAFSLLKVLRRRGYRRKVQVIVNMASSSSQAEKVFRRFNNAVRKYLNLSTEYIGSVWMDESMRSAVTLQKPVALLPKSDPSARSFYRLAERIDSVFNSAGTPKLPFSAYWQKIVERQLGENVKLLQVPSPSSNLAHNDNHNVSIPQVVDKKTPINEAPVKTIDFSPSPKDDVIKVQEPTTSESDTHNSVVAHEDRILELAEKLSQAPNGETSPYIESLEIELQQAKDEQSLTPSESRVASEHIKPEQVDSIDNSKKALAKQLASLSKESVASENHEDDQITVLDEDADKEWIDLRIRLNRFLNRPSTTPEQATTLLSNCIYSFGDQLGESCVDLLHGLLINLQPEDLSAEQKLLLKHDYERLALNEVVELAGSLNERADEQEPVRPQSIRKKVSYDTKGFGCQENLAAQIRSNNEQPLESFLESIKYASLAGSKRDDVSN